MSKFPSYKQKTAAAFPHAAKASHSDHQTK